MPSGSSTKGRRLARDALVPALRRILRLPLLAPDIIEAILEGNTVQSLMLERLEQPLPGSWDEERVLLSAGDATLTATR